MFTTRTVLRAAAGAAARSNAAAKQFLVVGNWKCNGSADLASQFASSLNGVATDKKVKLVVAPSTLHGN